MEDGNGGIGGAFLFDKLWGIPNVKSSLGWHRSRETAQENRLERHGIHNLQPATSIQPPAALPPAHHAVLPPPPSPAPPSSNCTPPPLHPPPPPILLRITAASGRLFSVWVLVTAVAHVPDSVSYTRQGTYSNDVLSFGIIYCLLTTDEYSS